MTAALANAKADRNALLKCTILFLSVSMVAGGNIFCNPKEESEPQGLAISLGRVPSDFGWEFQNWEPFVSPTPVEVTVEEGGSYVVENLVFDTEFYDFAILEDGAILEDESPKRCPSTIYRPFDMYTTRTKNKNKITTTPYGAVEFPRSPGVKLEGRTYSGSIVLEDPKCGDIEIQGAPFAGITGLTGTTAQSYHEFSFYSGGVFGMAFNPKLSGGPPGMVSPFLKMVTDPRIAKNVGMAMFGVVGTEDLAALAFGTDLSLLLRERAPQVHFTQVPSDELHWALPTSVYLNENRLSSDNTRVVFSTASVFNTAPAEALKKLADLVGAKMPEGGFSTLHRRYELPCDSLDQSKMQKMKLTFRIGEHAYYFTMKDLFAPEGRLHITRTGTNGRGGQDSTEPTTCQMNFVESDKWRLGVPFFMKYVLVLDVGDGKPSTIKRVGLLAMKSNKKREKKQHHPHMPGLLSYAGSHLPNRTVTSSSSSSTSTSAEMVFAGGGETYEESSSVIILAASSRHRNKKHSGEAVGRRSSGGTEKMRGDKRNNKDTVPLRPPPMVCKTQGEGKEKTNTLTRWAGGSMAEGQSSEKHHSS